MLSTEGDGFIVSGPKAVCSSPSVINENLLAGVYTLESHHGRLAFRRELVKRGVIQGRVAAVVDVPAGRCNVV